MENNKTISIFKAAKLLGISYNTCKKHYIKYIIKDKYPMVINIDAIKLAVTNNKLTNNNIADNCSKLNWNEVAITEWDNVCEICSAYKGSNNKYCTNCNRQYKLNRLLNKLINEDD